LVEDNARGQALRETRPVFGKGLSSREVVALRKAADAAAPCHRSHPGARVTGHL
jgi:hypothetical protein